MAKVQVTYFSDVLCIWAYLGERRVEELSKGFGASIEITSHYCSVFPDAWGKIQSKWGEEHGFEAFNQHLLEVARRFPHISVHKDIWRTAKPRTSASAHLFLNAIEAIENDQHGSSGGAVAYTDRLTTRAAWQMRCAFFAHAEDISDWSVLAAIAQKLGLDTAAVQERIQSSEAVAALAADYALAQDLNVEGSPSFIMNNGRQKLFGNVGYKLLEANVREVLRDAGEGAASWC